MIEIIPAIMPQSFGEVEEKMALVKEFVPLVQIDVMDGVLTKNATWPYLSQDLDSTFQNILEEKESMPYWDELEFEADLMVKYPEKIARDWLKAGAVRLILHSTSEGDLKELITKLREEGVPKGSPLYTEIGLAITADVSLESIKDLIPFVDFVQCMGIEEIGVQGSSFDSRILHTLSTLRAEFKDLILSVDGGVNLETAPLLVEAGANRLVSGSTIYRSENIKEAIDNLKG
ncbi:MAG: hypothetical protein RJA61_601 [Candidatus Parcubacteria bacterium]|jgi:ribulose-phosphate 3-epimerase